MGTMREDIDVKRSMQQQPEKPSFLLQSPAKATVEDSAEDDVETVDIAQLASQAREGVPSTPVIVTHCPSRDDSFGTPVWQEYASSSACLSSQSSAMSIVTEEGDEDVMRREKVASPATAEERQRKALVRAFLKEHGFRSVLSSKRVLVFRGRGASFRYEGKEKVYPIHVAAKQGNAALVEMLVLDGAQSTKKTSLGKTAMQIAQEFNKNDSHADVLHALNHLSLARQGGA